MPYVTGMKGPTVYWLKREGVIALELHETAMKKAGYNNVHVWVVEPDFNNPHFERQYPDCIQIEPLESNDEQSSKYTYPACVICGKTFSERRGNEN